MWVKRGREFSCEEFDDAAILFLLECGAEHLPVFRQVIGFVLSPTGLISASDFGDFAGNEFLRGCGSEVAVVCWTMRDGGYESIDSFWVFVSAEGVVYGFFPGVCVEP